MGLLIAAWSVFADRPATSTELFNNMWSSVGPALVASLFLLPLIVMDCIRWSNRYAGPMVRLHESLQELADGRSVAPLTFRKGDLWFEMAAQFNRISARLSELEALRAASPEVDAAADSEVCNDELVHAR